MASRREVVLMTEAKGYICDVCEVFGVSPGGSLPPGWLRITPSVVVFKREPGFAERVPGQDGGEGKSHLDVCGNPCLAALGVERAKAAGEATPGIYTREVAPRTSRKQRSDAGKPRGSTD